VSPEGREVELARELQAGHVEAFDEFVEIFRRKIFQFSMWTCGSPEDAEEIAQEALLKAFQNFRQLDDPARVKPWIFRIAKNACLLRRRKSVFAPEELSLEGLMPAHGPDGLQIADWSNVPDQQVLRGELRGLLQSAIRNLPDIYRTVLLFRDVEGMSTEQTAEALDVSIDVIKTRLHRARLAVRKELDAYLRRVEAAEAAH
jgi:RNA polymerase sigma-70 factor (ECF subfamily)